MQQMNFNTDIIDFGPLTYTETIYPITTEVKHIEYSFPKSSGFDIRFVATNQPLLESKVE
jgi:hypothetical protein